MRAGVSWDSVLRIDGMVKLMLEQYRVSYLPIESVSMQERVRAVEFVLSRCGLSPVEVKKPRTRSTTIPPIPNIHQPSLPGVTPKLAPPTSVESWPYALVDSGDHEA